MPPPNVQTGCLRSLPSLQLCSPVSGCDDRLSPTNCVASSPPASNSDLHPATCKIAYISPTRISALQTISDDASLQNVYFEYSSRLAHVRELIRSNPPIDHHSIFHNPPLELRYEYQCDPATDGYPFLIFRNDSRCTSTGFLWVTRKSARAGIHRGDQLKVC